MSTWKSASLSALIPSDISTLATQAQSITTLVSNILSIVKTAIDISRPLVGFPNIDLASALLAAIDKFKEDFLGAGFYMCSMWDYPLRQYYRSGYSGEEFGESFRSDLILSLSDPFDPNVPTFSGNVGMLVIVGGTSGELSDILNSILTIGDAFPSWTDIANAYSKMYKVVWRDFIDNAVVSLKSNSLTYSAQVSRQSKRVKEVLRAKWDALEHLEISDLAALASGPLESLGDIDAFITKANESVGSSRYPDWESTTLRKIVPPLVELVDQALAPLGAALQSGAGIFSAIDGFLEVVDFKIAQLQILVDKIDTFLAALSKISALGSLYAVYLASSNGVSGIAQELESATNPPFGSSKGYFFGTALLAGGPGLTPFENVFAGVGS